MDNNRGTSEENAMDVDIPCESNGSTTVENLYPVEQYGSGSRAGSPIFSEEKSGDLGSDSENGGGVACKAGNQACPSLEEIGNSSSKVKPCGVCCSEPRFCRECCCIFCLKTVSYSYGNYSFIKCEAVVEDNYICGHIAHLDCALQTYAAGTVGGSFGLDAEYYCWRCDARTDLVPHVTRLLKTCKSISSRTSMENVLNVGFRVLGNSEKSSAKRLFHRIGFALEKLKTGASLDEIWRAEDMPTFTEGSRAGSPIFSEENSEHLGSDSENGEHLGSDSENGEHLGSDSENGVVACKAGNQACPSLEEIGNSSSNVMPCDVCCSEDCFCRECCCILCCKTVSFSNGNYSFIECEAVVEDNYICGHIAHVDCALRTFMAGTIGGSMGLDAEYYCRRCDAKTDLVPHVTRLLKTCESIPCRTEVENVLNVGFRVLRNSKKSGAKRLFRRIVFALEKLKTGTSLDEIWRAEDIDMPTATEGLLHNEPNTPEVPKHPELLELEAMKLETEIEQVLGALKKAQESEYKLAEERLHAQKDYILHLHELLNKDRSELSERISSNPDEVFEAFEAVMDRLDRVKMETQRLRDMKEVAKGFGKTSKNILKDYFDLETDS